MQELPALEATYRSAKRSTKLYPLFVCLTFSGGRTSTAGVGERCARAAEHATPISGDQGDTSLAHGDNVVGLWTIVYGGPKWTL